MSQYSEQNERSEGKPFFNQSFWVKLFFVGISALLWFLTKLSQDDYVDKIEYAVQFTNQKSDMVISEISDQYLSITVEANGYDLLSEQADDLKVIKLSLDEADIKNEQTYVWDTRKNLDIITRQLPSKLRIKQVSPKSIEVSVDKLMKRTVEVIPKYDLKLETPYRLYGDIEIEPRKVNLWLPRSSKDSIINVYTDKFEISSEAPSQKITLQLAQLPDPFAVTPLQVTASYEVRSFTEKTMEIPIEVINVPVNGSVRLFPEKVTVTMNISQEDYDIITAADFKCVADFKDLHEEQNRVSLKMKSVPEHIELISWGPKSVEFIIINE